MHVCRLASTQLPLASPGGPLVSSSYNLQTGGFHPTESASQGAVAVSWNNHLLCCALCFLRQLVFPRFQRHLWLPLQCSTGSESICFPHKSEQSFAYLCAGWLIPSEVHDLHTRSAGQSITVFTQLLSGAIVTQVSNSPAVMLTT